MSPIGVNIGGMPYGLGLGWMPYPVPTCGYGAIAQTGIQIRIAFGIGFPPVYLVISRDFGNRSGYDTLWGLCLAGGLAFCSSWPCLLPFLRKDNQRKGKSEWVRLSHGGEKPDPERQPSDEGVVGVDGAQGFAHPRPDL